MDGGQPAAPNQERRRKSSCPPFVALESTINIRRAAHTQSHFDELHPKREKEEKAPLRERIRSSIYCDKKRAWKLLTGYFPVVRFLRYYRLREFAVSDISAGLTVGVVHIPQALAFGALTSVKLENGLFTSIWPVLLYVLFGTSAHCSMGTSAVISILTAATVDRLGAAWAADKPWLLNVTSDGLNGTLLPLEQVPEYLDFKEEIAMGVAFLSGLMMIAMGVFKLGFITFYLSDSFFAAFTSAAAVHIGVSQLPSMLGINIPRYAGIAKVVFSFKALCVNIAEINGAAIIIAIVCCVAIQLVKDCVNERFKHRLPAPVPVELLVVVVSTVISYFGQLHGNFGLDIVGSFKTGFPVPKVPMRALEESPKYLVDSFIMAILIFANTIAMVKICAKKHNYEVDDSQELIAYGMCNAVSSFFQCFPSAVAPPRSMVASSMNVRTTLNGVFSAVVMILVVMVVGPLFNALPKAALGAIIFIALKGLFVQILDGRKYWRINKFDFVIWFTTFFSTVLLDIDVGLGVGVAVSLITVVFQTQFARGYRLAKVGKEGVLVEAKRYTEAQEFTGMVIFKFQSNLYFANAEIFRSSLYSHTINPRKLLKLLKKREAAYEKQVKENLAQGVPPPGRRNSVMTGEDLLGPVSRRPSVFGGGLMILEELERAAREGQGQGQEVKPRRKISASSMDNPAFTIDENTTFQGQNFLTVPDTNGLTPVKNGLTTSKSSDSLSESGRRSNRHSIDSSITILSDDEELDEYGEVVVSDERLKQMRRVHHIVLDCSCINYMDSSGANVLSHIYTEYQHVHIQLFLAKVSSYVRRAMKHAGVFDKIPQDHFFLEVPDAIAVARTKQVEAFSEQELEDFTEEEANEQSYVTKM